MWNATGLKSLSDITVAPVVPTILSTHCSQNELHLTPDYCLAPTGNSLQSLFRLLFLLKRIFLIRIYRNNNIIHPACQELWPVQGSIEALHIFMDSIR